MHLQTDDSRMRYDEIWRPHQSLTHNFITSHDSSTINVINLLKLLRRWSYDLSFVISRELKDLEEMDWENYFRNTDRSRYLASLFVRNTPVVVPGVRKNDIFSNFCRSFILQPDIPEDALFFDIGCGIGNLAFEMQVLENMGSAQFFGIDISHTAIETARSLANWIGSGRFEFSLGNLAEPSDSPIDCGGRDVVFFSVSVLNKIRVLDENIFQTLLTRVTNHGRIRFIHIESFGWQIYKSKELNQFYLELDQTINEFSKASYERMKTEIRANEKSEALDNINLANVILQNTESGFLRIKFFQANAIGLRDEKPYSVVILTHG